MAPGVEEQAGPRGLAEIGRRLLLVVSIFAALGYIAWRAAYTYHPEYLAYSIVFIIADAMGVLAYVTFALTLWNLTPRKPAPPPRHGLSVDVWVPTLSEEEEILRRTVFHCVNMDYPHRTYVLDDGRRAWVKDLCAELGAHYITRPDNRGAKAGNLNHALAETDGELIATFDADFVPAKDFLTKLLGYFEDDRVALVQTPQHYHNVDSFQHRFVPAKNRLWGTQDLFFEALMVGKDNMNAAFWIGTGAILRRRAIEEIGGFPTASVVEDMLTSIEIHARGWKTVYVNKPLSFGIAPAYLSQFLSQRLRWTRGVMQIVRTSNPLFKRGLTLAQRLTYLNSVLHFFDGLPRAVYYLVPGLYLCTGATPLFLKPAVLRLVLIYLALHLVTVKIISKGNVKIFLNELYFMVHFLTFLRGNLSLLSGREIKFGVTAKRGKQRIAPGHLAGPALVFAFSVGSLILAYLRYGAGDHEGLNPFALSITVPFCIFYAGLALTAIVFGLRRPYNPDSYYFYDSLPVEVAAMPGLSVVKALNERELILLTPARMHPNESVAIRLHLPGEACRAKINVKRCARLLDTDDAELFETHATFDRSEDGVEKRLIRHFFEHAVPRFLRKVLARGTPRRWRRIVSRRAPRRELSVPILYENPPESPARIGVLENLSRTGLLMVTNEPIPAGAPLRVSFARFKHLPGRVARVSDERAAIPNLVRIGVAFDYAVELPRDLIKAASRQNAALFKRRILS